LPAGLPAGRAPVTRATRRHGTDYPQPGEAPDGPPDDALGVPVFRGDRPAPHTTWTRARVGPGASSAAHPPAGARASRTVLRRILHIYQLSMRNVGSKATAHSTTMSDLRNIPNLLRPLATS